MRCRFPLGNSVFLNACIFSKLTYPPRSRGMLELWYERLKNERFAVLQSSVAGGWRRRIGGKKNLVLAPDSGVRPALTEARRDRATDESMQTTPWQSRAGGSDLWVPGFRGSYLDWIPSS